jgi:putative membrane protein
MRFPRWIGLAFLFGVIAIIDLSSDSVTMTDDGGVLIEPGEISSLALAALIVGLTAGSAYLLVRWWSFRWWLEGGAIWTSGGIVNRWTRRVSLGQIAVVDRSSTPIRRIFGVSRIAIETTATDLAASDVLLGYLSNRTANRLENVLIRELVFDGHGDETHRFDPIRVDHLGWWELLLAGATTVQITRALVLLYATLQFLQDESGPSIEIGSEEPGYGLSPGQFLILQVLLIVGAIWLASTIQFLAAFARYRLGRHEGWLILETGILRRSRRLIRIDAIDGLEISRSPLQRLFRNKRAMLRMRLPAYGAPPIYALVLHPAVRDRTLPRLTHQIADMTVATSDAMCGKGVHRLAAGCRAAYVLYWPMRIAAACAVLVSSLVVFVPDAWWYGLLPLALAAPAAIMGLLAWRNVAWHAGDGWLTMQQGTFTLTSIAARTDRIQYVRWSRAMRSRPDATLSLAISVATSGGAGVLAPLLSIMQQPVDSSLVRLRAIDAGSARAIAISGGFEQSLPAATLGT